MKFIALLTPRPGRRQDQFLRLSVDEERRVWQLYTRDVIRQMYFQPEPLRVSLEFEADSSEAVHEHLASLPMVEADLFHIDVVRLGPWLPLTALFGTEASPSPS